MTTKFPKTVGACIDQLYNMRAERLDLQKQADEMKKKEAELEDHILNQFGKSEIAGAKGGVATAAIKTSTTVKIDDWDQFIAFVAKKKAWDMLQKRPGVTAVKDRWDNGEEVPGTSPLTTVSLSLTKV